MRTTVSFVDISDVLKHIGIGAADFGLIFEVGFDEVSFGDAAYTLISNYYALHCIVRGIEALDNHKATMPLDEIETRFWEIVGKDDYVNLEC